MELGRVDAFYKEVRLYCDSCGEFFSCKKTLRNHEEEHLKSSLKTKELELEKLILEQKYELSSALINLNQKEVTEAKICECRAGRNCKIFHELYNWRFSNYKSNVNIFKKLYTCLNCDEEYSCSGKMKEHIETAHSEIQEEKMGEIDRVNLHGGYCYSCVNPLLRLPLGIESYLLYLLELHV